MTTTTTSLRWTTWGRTFRTCGTPGFRGAGGMANLSDAVGYAANKVGLDSLRDTAHNLARSWERDAQNRMGRVVDPEGFRNRVAGGMGSSLSMMIPAAAVGGRGCPVGRHAFGVAGAGGIGRAHGRRGHDDRSLRIFHTGRRSSQVRNGSGRFRSRFVGEVSPLAAGWRQRCGKKAPKPS